MSLWKIYIFFQCSFCKLWLQGEIVYFWAIWTFQKNKTFTKGGVYEIERRTKCQQNGNVIEVDSIFRIFLDRYYPNNAWILTYDKNNYSLFFQIAITSKRSRLTKLALNIQANSPNTLQDLFFINQFWLCAALLSHSQPQSKWLQP